MRVHQQMSSSMGRIVGGRGKGGGGQIPVGCCVITAGLLIPGICHGCISKFLTQRVQNFGMKTCIKEACVRLHCVLILILKHHYNYNA